MNLLDYHQAIETKLTYDKSPRFLIKRTELENILKAIESVKLDVQVNLSNHSTNIAKIEKLERELRLLRVENTKLKVYVAKLEHIPALFDCIS